MTSPADRHRAIPRRASLTDEVVAAVREGVRTGAYLPGELYSVYQLAEQLEVSRSPVREALLRLAEAGLVAFERNRGFRIVLPDPRDIAEIFGVRLALELPAVRRIADRRDPAVLAEIDHCAAAMREAARSGDRAGFFRDDQRLHELILRGSGNARAAAIVGSLRDTVRLLGASTAGRSRTLQEIETEHRPVVEALRAGDPGAAEQAMRDHLTRTGRLLVAQALGDADHTDALDRLWTEVVG
ncbi:GntR family transcriptional regulator [Nocardiopsis ansamitocini]|uniref:Transcriptional regulator n=1 Tax=Nocardiopsis ansamitocini TaxID=1670832 RepID=A0A9W6P8Y3_9ACTN|nr:GntR family transcriptional regulator [Nocardiopsis ansamitocini]GLU49780.1 transcriptional regulator [Nocardiopsis ansamitocini]